MREYWLRGALLKVKEGNYFDSLNSMSNLFCGVLVLVLRWCKILQPVSIVSFPDDGSSNS